MAIPMNNNTLANSSRDRAQRLFNKNVELENKRRKAAQAKIPSDPNTWQQMRENYESILLEDHTFSEKHDIEYALWQLHYKRIEELRAHYTAAQNSTTQNTKSQTQTRPGFDRITKIRSQFKTFLSEATGFYHDLMVKIRAKYGLSLDYMSDDSQNDAKKGLISCHRCFIYLGDLARYKGLYGENDSKTRDFDAASSYYRQAANLWPTSGNPHHQLAILASYSGDELLAVYRYFRSLAVDTPFTTARDNLIIAFEKNRQSYCQLVVDTKPAPSKKLPARMNGKVRNKGETRRFPNKDRKTEHISVEEKELNMPEILKAFSIRFVRLNGILFTRTSLETFEEIFSVARTEFLQLLSSGNDETLNFGLDFNECKLYINRFISIIIFTVHNANKEPENQSYTEILQRSVVLQNAFTAIFDFMSLVIERCFQLKDPSGSFLLPGIMIFVEWLACCQDVITVKEMDEKQIEVRLSFWNRFVSFLNKMMMSASGSRVNGSDDETCFFNMCKYDESETNNRLALPEDVELRGFLPLVPAHIILDFSRTSYFGNDGNKEKNVRVQRIIAAGKSLAANIHAEKEKIYFDKKSKKFFFGFEPQNNNEIEIEDEEDDDEVIVFKPSEKPLMSSDVISVSRGFPIVPPASSVNGNGNGITQFLEMENGISDLNLLGNGFSTIGQPQMVGFNAYNDPETVIPSKFDSVMTSAPGFDTIPSITKSVKSVGWNKSPVSRPVRHFGPPPGFNTGVNVRTENVNSNPNLNLNTSLNLNPRLDDYSWLDGYELPYSGYGDGFGLPQPNKLLNMNKTSLGMESFPFPGKQVSQIGNGNGNGWVDYKVPEHSSVYQQEMVNEQFIQQYQGQQSLWEGGRFFV